MGTMLRQYPKEFREDVIRVARNRKLGVRIEDLAADFGTLRVVSEHVAGQLCDPQRRYAFVRLLPGPGGAGASGATSPWTIAASSNPSRRSACARHIVSTIVTQGVNEWSS